MSRRTARAGVLLLAGLLLGSFAFAGAAAGQESEPLKVDFKESDPAPGKLGVTIGMSGSAWDPSLQLSQDAFSASINGSPVKITGATVFLVDAGVDSGVILDQQAVPVEEDDTVQTLHERIKIVEREMLVAITHQLATRTWRIVDRKVLWT